MNFISLFSGIGGFDRGFELAGMKSIAVCDIDKHALGVLASHFPNAEQFDDVRKIGVNTHERGSVDLICGGFPCQDVSIAGKRAGLAGERSGLWFEFARIVEELKPGWVVIENVPGLLSSNGGRDMETIVRALVEFGYGVAWRVLDAQYFGLAQRRRRVFIVASLGSGRAAEVLFEREGGAGNTPPSRETGQGTANTFTVRSGKEGGGKGYLGFEDGAMTLGGQPQWVEEAKFFGHSDGVTLKINEVANTLNGQTGSETTHMIQGVVGALCARDYKGIGNQYVDEGKCVVQSSARMVAFGEYVDDATDLVWDRAQITSPQNRSKLQREKSPTINGSGQMHVGVRRLTPLECERLQGFPDGWTDGQSDTQRYKQLGNAVAVPVAEWIGRRIMTFIDKQHNESNFA